MKKSLQKVRRFAEKLLKLSLIASLGYSLAGPSVLTTVMADDDDWDDYDDDWDDWDDDDWYDDDYYDHYDYDDDWDDWDDDDWYDDDWDDWDDDDWDDDDWDDDDDDWDDWDDDDDDWDDMYDDDDWDDWYEDRYDYLDDDYDDWDDDDYRGRPRVAAGSTRVNAEFFNRQPNRPANFMDPTVTDDDDVQQGFQAGQQLQFQEVIRQGENTLPNQMNDRPMPNNTVQTPSRAQMAPAENLQEQPGRQIITENRTVQGVNVKTQEAIPTLAQADKQAQYQAARDRNNRNTIITQNEQNVNYESPVKANEKTQTDFNQNVYVDEVLLNQEFLNLLNADRQAAGLAPVEYGSHLQQGVDTRANDLASIGHIRVNNQPHVRLDGSSFREDFNYLGGEAKNALGENTALATYTGNPNQLVSEKALAEQFYNQWKASPSHYENMMSPDYNYSAVSVKMGNKNQLAGNQYNSLIGVQVLDTSVQ